MQIYPVPYLHAACMIMIRIGCKLHHAKIQIIFMIERNILNPQPPVAPRHPHDHTHTPPKVQLHALLGSDFGIALLSLLASCTLRLGI